MKRRARPVLTPCVRNTSDRGRRDANVAFGLCLIRVRSEVDATLNRLFSLRLHGLPFAIIFIILLCVCFLHETGSKDLIEAEKFLWDSIWYLFHVERSIRIYIIFRSTHNH